MRIKRLFKYLVLMLTLLTLSGVVPVYADEGNADSIEEGASEAQNSLTGFSKFRSGYLIYITDNTGTPVSDIILVPFSSKPANGIVLDGLVTRVTDTIYTTISDYTISQITNGGFNQPPFCTVTDTAYGEPMKQWLLADSDGDGIANTYDLIVNLYGDEDGSLRTAFKDNDYYLCIEGVIWLGLENSENTTFVAGTSYSLNKIFNSLGKTYCDKIRRQRLSHCGYLVYDWAGCSAPTVNSGQKESYDNLIARGNGYGIIMVRSNEEPAQEQPSPNAPNPVNVTDYLGANQLNYYFTDFQPDMREANSNAMIKNMGAESVWKKHTRSPYSNSTLKGGKWHVSEEATSSLVDFYCDEDDSRNKVLFYRASSGLWGSVDDLVKDFTTSQTDVRPGYGFTYSRSIFGDNIVVCDYRGIGTSEKSFITDKLKLSVGHTKSSGLSYTANTEFLSDIVKSSTYTFSAYSTENYIETVSYIKGRDDKGTEDTSDDELIYDSYTVSHSKKYITSDTDYPDAKISYKLDHGIYKYTPMNLGTSSSYSEGTIYKGGNNAITRAIFSSEVGTLSVIPEIKYKMYKMTHDGEWGTNDTPVPETVYCMGEKERTSTGSTIHGYKAYIPSGWLQGTILVDTPLTGTRALEFIENFDDAQDVIQMSPQGTGYTVASTNNPQIACVSMSLDLYDGDISEVSSVVFKPSESWTNPDTVTAHTEFVNAIKSNITTEVTSAYFSDKGANSRVSNFDSMSFDITDTTVSSTTTKQIRILVEGGQIVSGKDDLIDEIETSYGVDEDTAKSILSEWGLETQIRDMLEHSGSVNNKSGSSGSATSKWYDEETSALCISVHKTNIQIGNIVLSDKFDYGSSASQDAYNIGLNGSNGRQIRFFFSLGFINHEISFGGNTYNVSDKLYLIDNTEIKGARALISNQTSHDMLF